MPTRRSITIGERFTRLTVIAFHGTNKHRQRVWKCLCDCGKTILVASLSLASGNTKSCSCHKADISRSKAMPERKLPEFNVWRGMKDRCYNRNHKSYPHYGGRGIQVHPEWVKSFSVFFDYVGQRPSSCHQIERINNNGNYEPGNVKWETPDMQARNRRNTVLITYKGKTMCAKDWAQFLGLNYGTFNSRRRYGWSIERILTTPVTVEKQRKTVSENLA